ncbi:portal protein [Anoxybacillus sp. UARK-01]|uniref:phage portal protein n=1 Tax=Anoxybacillus sp. UARK-01 TaxID=1895648 RepID=UPI0009BB896B|nr:phage portal protein [Anoxybacillus sp. UARK-01]OQM47527.1 portal protein [Anoxybacillus sp. UARK-01]
MFQSLIMKTRRWLYRVGILKGIQNLNELKDVNISEEMYQQIDVWKALYKGYYEPFHKLRYKTIDGWKTRKMDTLQMAKIVSSEMAGLVFNEKCEISISDENLSDFIDEVFEDNKFYKEFQDYIEYMFAYGGAVIKPYVKDEKVMLSLVTADCFIPISWHNDTILEGVFISEYIKGNKTYTHLEWHTWEGNVYVVRNELYESNGSDLGVRVPLSILAQLYGVQEETRISGLKKSIFTYIKPNTANNIDTQSPLGISIYANALDTMKALDTAFDSFNREFRLGKKRIVVPAHMVKTVVNPQTGEMYRYFDSSDETYEAFNSGNMDKDEIKDISVELRVEEHISAINALLNLFAMQTGFSTGTFSFDGQAVKTATEVVSENSKTFKNKKSHEIIIEEGIKEIIDSIIAVAQLYGLYNGPNEYEVSVAFDDSIVEDQGAEINKQIQLVSNGLTSKKRAIMKIHKLTEEEALKLLQEIREEQQTATAEAIDFFGMNRQGGD